LKLNLLPSFPYFVEKKSKPAMIHLLEKKSEKKNKQINYDLEILPLSNHD